jgi:hypothetical protein
MWAFSMSTGCKMQYSREQKMFIFTVDYLTELSELILNNGRMKMISAWGIGKDLEGSYSDRRFPSGNVDNYEKLQNKRRSGRESNPVSFDNSLASIPPFWVDIYKSFETSRLKFVTQCFAIRTSECRENVAYVWREGEISFGHRSTQIRN